MSVRLPRQKPFRFSIQASEPPGGFTGSADDGDSKRIDDEIVLAAPADTDILPNDLPDTEVAAIVALGATDGFINRSTLVKTK